MKVKLILTGIIGLIIGILIGYSFIQSVQSYQPQIIHDTINK
jgi:ABC-type lipoprotein release transport system permease subunit